MATFRVFEDQENGLGARRPVKECQVPVQHQKRSVLGVLSNNVSLPASQKPHKQDVKYQGKTVEAGVKSVFSVYTDDVHKEETKSEKATVVNLPTALHRLPLQELQSKNNLQTSILDSLTLKDTQSSKNDESLDTTVCSPMSVDHSGARLNVTNEVKEKGVDKLMNFLDYRDDVYNYLLVSERRSRPKASYMRHQPDITTSMRCILVDWLVEVAEEYKLQGETLYLAVSYIDRFLSQMSVQRSKLQLVGTAAMFIAAKYEEIFPPDVSEFAYITDDTYSKKTVLRMEQMVLKVLAYDVSAPTVLGFLSFYIEAALKINEETGEQENMTEHDQEMVRYLAMYLSELSLVEGDPYLKFLHSIRAASAIALARHTLGWSPAWTKTFENLSGYTLMDLQPCISCLMQTFVGAPNHPQQAVREKYRNNRWHNVAALTPRSEQIV